jgi:hypothetical protein
MHIYVVFIDGQLVHYKDMLGESLVDVRINSKGPQCCLGGLQDGGKTQALGGSGTEPRESEDSLFMCRRGTLLSLCLRQ